MSNLVSKRLLIGQVASQSGISIKTIRYYEELGLIQSLDRTEGGFRLFDSKVMTRLAFIKRSQHLGLSLSEIKKCLKIYDQGEAPCDQIRQQLEAKITEIDAKIHQLKTLKSELQGLLKTWNPDQEKSDKICPILQ